MKKNTIGSEYLEELRENFFKFLNLQEKPAELFHHVFYSFFVTAFHTHFYKPVYSIN